MAKNENRPTTKAMRVLCVTGHGDRPETETFIGLQKMGVELHVLCPHSAPYFDHILGSGVSATDFKLKSRLDFSAIKTIRNYLIDHDIDIIHLFNNRAVSNGIMAAKNLPTKIIVYRGTVGNVSYWDPGSWMTYLNPKVDRIVCVSEAVRNFFLNIHWLWFHIPPEKPVTIYKGHAISWYSEKPASLGPLGVPQNAFVVGCTGRYRPHKGIHILIEAMRLLPRQLPIHLVLIGDMDDPALRKKIQKSMKPDRIHLLGYRTNATALQAACDAVVLPALRREGLPKVIIEAMACGVPPIVTNAGGSPELIENGRSGIIVPPGDPLAIAKAILKLYENAAIRTAIGKKARARIASDFNIETTIENTFTLYESCLRDIA